MCFFLYLSHTCMHKTHKLTIPAGREVHFCPSHHLHPYFVYASREGLGEPAHGADSPEPSLLANGCS